MARERRARRSKVLKPLHPSMGIEREYQRRLEALVDEMAGSLLWWLRSQYRKTPPRMALDAPDGGFGRTPAAALNRRLDELGDQWLSRFDEAAPKLAQWFTGEVSKRSDTRLRQILRDGGISVKFQMTPAQRDILKSTIDANVTLIKSIAQEHLSDVAGAVQRSVQIGGDIGGLTKELQHRYGITRRRAALIARQENSRATAVLTRSRQIEIGATEAVWLHSGGGHHPRPEHVAFSGKKYDVTKGAFLEGRWTWPGVEINCRCVPRITIDSFGQ